MRVIGMYKATDAPQSVYIRIEDEIPDTQDLQSHDILFQQAADTLAEALYNSLPQGIRYRLMIRLMEFELVNFTGMGVKLR